LSSKTNRTTNYTSTTAQAILGLSRRVFGKVFMGVSVHDGTAILYGSEAFVFSGCHRTYLGLELAKLLAAVCPYA
jgi:hypothetical protein